MQSCEKLQVPVSSQQGLVTGRAGLQQVFLTPWPGLGFTENLKIIFSQSVLELSTLVNWPLAPIKL
jgi:hypothetical protein